MIRTARSTGLPALKVFPTATTRFLTISPFILRRSVSQYSLGLRHNRFLYSAATRTSSYPAPLKGLPQFGLRAFCSSISKMNHLDGQHSKPTAECITNHLERPVLDDRSYRVIRLPNKLEALLIHDPDTDKSSAAMDVNAGSFSDAEDMPGMAHAVEHLLFMGTEKYPKENEYNQYLTSHNGYSNAFTASTSTNYYFEVAARSELSQGEQTNGVAQLEGNNTGPLYGALDRFAQFFISPLFLEDTLDRELRAVDSENKKNLQSDTWRLHQLSKSLSNPKHPFCHFSTGNLQTLRDEPLARGVKIREEFMKFHKDQYSANRMKLVVLGNESLDTLQSWVEELFSDVRNKDLPQNRWDDIPPFTDDEVGTVVFAKPVMDTRKLDLYFPYQDEENLYDSKPGNYLSHLIGHEGPGSIFAYAKSKGWINGLSSGSYPLCPGSAFFTIEVRLTPEGLENYMDVVKAIFQYISVLKDTPPQEWIFDEVKEMAEVDFRFKQKSPASSTTSGLSSVMQQPLPRERLLSGQRLMRKFDAEAISRGLTYLRADNFRLTVVSQDLGEGKIKNEKWYGTEFRTEKMSPNFLDELKKAESCSANERPAELFLPSKNEFIPSRLDVEKRDIKEPATAPKLIRRDDNVRLWYKKDDQFWVPKANMYLDLRNPVCNLTPRNAVMTTVFTALVDDALEEYSYDADIAGLGYDLGANSIGMTLSVSGYNDKMSVLLEKLLTAMRDLEIKDNRFEIVKERIARGFRNAAYTPPYHQVGQFTRWLANENGWIIDQFLSEIDTLGANDLRAFHPLLLGQFHIETLIHGNLYREDALRLTDLVETILTPRTLPPSQWKVPRSILYQPGSNYIYSRPLKDSSNVNHCIEYTLMIRDCKDRAEYAKLLLFSQLTNESAFDQLRTKEQLGYVVFSGGVRHATTVAYRILIQSEKHPDYLEKRIENYFRVFRKEFESMSLEEFESHKQSAVNKRLEKLKNLSQESRRFWNHIANEYFYFEEVYEDAARLKTVTKDDMVAFYDLHIDPSSPLRSKFSVHLLAQASSAETLRDLDPAEQRKKIISNINKHLNSEGIGADQDKLEARLGDVDVSQGDQNAILSTVESYLKNDLETNDERVKEVIEKSKQVLVDLLSSLGIQTSEIQGNGSPGAVVPTSKPVIIEDVPAFKAAMPLSAGATPIRDLTEYESLVPKL